MIDMKYDRKIYKKWREHAITKFEDIQIGKEYFTNTDPESFVITDIVTTSKVWPAISDDDGEEPRWVVYQTRGGDGFFSLFDYNVGASYNPWLIFDNEDDAITCRDELKVTFNDNNESVSISDYDHDPREIYDDWFDEGWDK